MTHEGLEARDECVRQVLAMLVAGSYDELVSSTPGSRVSAGELRGAVDDYGHTLVMPRDASGRNWLKVDCSPDVWSVDVPLFTAEEGRSDLTLSLTIHQLGDGLYRAEIDDLHVL